MGSGPAVELAVSYPGVSALVLISPYTSLRSAVKSVVGSLAALLVKERFDNLSLMDKVACPTLIVHGQLDQMLDE